MKTKRLLLGITGSIAAYKAAEIASALTQRGVAVDAVLTVNGARFITPLTLGALTRRPVIGDMWADHHARPPHIEAADAADLVLIAPATANILAKMAHGIADDTLTAILLATPAPLLVAPAMNGKMWQHPATRANVSVLRQRGVEFIGPSSGMLACGYEGVGRLAPVEEIIATVSGRLCMGSAGTPRPRLT
ncbi:MAG: phosphopantothenoylcysteine decarboxylase [Verrucomicrobiales bacterium]|jgi:phosphopantothenoylcysteine synthetase/decarboxylase|nr:phosphopantothenoylcysteine decarboxylase [Verrucomicrobiales bacterium]